MRAGRARRPFCLLYRHRKSAGGIAQRYRRAVRQRLHPFRAFGLCDQQYLPETGDGFVVVTNGSNGWAVYRQIVCDWIEWKTGERPACKIPVQIALISVLTNGTGEDAVTHYTDLKSLQSDSYNFNEDALNGLGYALIQKDRLQDAIALFKLNVEEYPEASNPYDSLGEAYMMAGETALAIKNYRRSVELDPGNTNAVEKLTQLEEM